MAGSGSVISRDVPDFALVYCNPARVQGFVCKCGKRLENLLKKTATEVIYSCVCGEEIAIKKEDYQLLKKRPA